MIHRWLKAAVFALPSAAFAQVAADGAASGDAWSASFELPDWRAPPSSKVQIGLEPLRPLPALQPLPPLERLPAERPAERPSEPAQPARAGGPPLRKPELKGEGEEPRAPSAPESPARPAPEGEGNDEPEWSEEGPRFERVRLPGIVYWRHPSFGTESEEWRRAEREWDSHGIRVSDETREKLERRFRGLKRRQGALLRRAKRLDRAWAGLEADRRAREVSGEFRRLEQAWSGLQSRRAAYDADCAGRTQEPDPYRACLDRLEGLRRELDGLRREARSWKAKAEGLIVELHVPLERARAYDEEARRWRAEVKAFRRDMAAGERDLPPPGFCKLLEIKKTSEGKPYLCRAICNRNGSYQPYEYRPIFGRERPCGVREKELFPLPRDDRDGRQP